MTENCDGGIGIWKIWTAEFGIAPNFERFFGGMAELPTLEPSFQTFIQTVSVHNKLFGGTVPPNNKLFGGTFPPYNKLLDGTVQPDNKLFGGTVLPNNELFSGTVLNDSMTKGTAKHQYFET